MIIDCPSCATRFSIHDELFVSGPRRVRCTKCQHVWAVGKLNHSPPAAPPLPQAVGGSFADILADIPENFEIEPSDETAAVTDEQPRAQWGYWISFLYLTPRQAKLTSLILLAVVLAVGWTARMSLAIRSPILAQIYGALGIQYEKAKYQLEIQLTRAEKCLVAGRDMLCIDGVVTHKGHEPLDIPLMYVTALNVDNKEFTDSNGHPILTWTVKTDASKLLPGESRPFSLTEPYPDQAITDFDFGFIDDEHPSNH